jgi:plastocyanin
MNWMLPITLATLALLVLPAAQAQPEHKPDGFGSGDIRQGQSWSWTATGPGMHYYHCHYHLYMTEGRIRVQEGAAATVSIHIRDFAFRPIEVTVAPGGTVTWTNYDAATHSAYESLGPAETPGDGGGKGLPGPGLAPLLVIAGLTVALRRGRL